ncbi:hypothetical protein CKO28_20850 [Rhodovibrio sodomensis]|uniref:Branched-chain amino acid transporter n=1 Tax=Rhodovibrio sodomensis TaxID=1088 RepID=A0ABS1DL69_9PROT|nr:AzlD domain-containing protein [Rhodovibrio sodomensis]MBK1670478.1 hypothetical protein [Rhodovibrio sodomensis]
MTEAVSLIAGLAGLTFAIRLAGYLAGAHLPATGRWARAFDALPGCLIAALVTLLLAEAGRIEGVAAVVAFTVAAATRSLPVTMIAGIATVAGLQAVV